MTATTTLDDATSIVAKILQQTVRANNGCWSARLAAKRGAA